MQQKSVVDGNVELFGDLLGKKINVVVSNGQVRVVSVAPNPSQNINNLIANLNQLSYKKVEDLNDIKPEEAGSSNYIYLVPTGETSGNLYNEYMVFENKLEPIGSWEVNLDNYVTTTTFETKVNELSGLISTNKTNIETLQRFTDKIGDLDVLITEVKDDTLVDQVNRITQKLMWQEIVI